VNFIRTNFALRGVTAIAAVIGWLVLSNHCALAEIFVMKTAPAKESGCCNHHPAPAKDEKPWPPVQQECCKSLTVIVHDGAKLPMAPFLKVARPDAWLAVLPLSLPGKNHAASDTGPPPNIPGFVELVLHRSLRSHAPPSPA